MAKTKQRTELLLPGDTGWTLWSGPEHGALTREHVFDGDGTFARDAQRHVLAVPAASTWVLPAWLKGDVEHLRDMAMLHVERLGIRCTGAVTDLQVNRIASDDAAHLACIIALKDAPAPLASHTRLPGEVAISAACYALPEDAITIWRELGKLVIAITSGPQLIYFSPLSSQKLDNIALGEINNICMQLGFQRVLSTLDKVVLWIEDGDLSFVARMTGVQAERAEKPVPNLPTRGWSELMPADLIAARARQQKSARTRLLALGAGALAAVALAFVIGMTIIATKEKDALLAKVAQLAPRASKVEYHRKSWEEVASAVDPKRFPMDVLLRCMESKVAPEVMLTLFENSPDKVVLQGRAPSSSIALQYMQEIKNSESLTSFAWDGPPPVIGSDDSTSFDLKGTRQ